MSYWLESNGLGTIPLIFSQTTSLLGRRLNTNERAALATIAGTMNDLLDARGCSP
jgi:hypothetical protein